MGFNVRSIGAFAGGAAEGIGFGVKTKNAYQEGNRKQTDWEDQKSAAKDVDQAMLSRLARAHQDAQVEFGDTFKNFLAQSPVTPSFTGAAAAGAASQPPASFAANTAPMDAVMRPAPTPMLTAASNPRRLAPRLPFADIATFDSQE